MLFEDGSREPLHGHNYRVRVKGNSLSLDNEDMVFDFLDIKPIIRDICHSLDHKLLLPTNNSHLQTIQRQSQWELRTSDGSFFSIPQTDVLFLPVHNTSAECLAMYLANKVSTAVKLAYDFTFASLEVEVEETPGQCAIYILGDQNQ